MPRTDGPRRSRRSAPDLHAPLRAMSTDPIEVLAIGASTGGIHALEQLLRGAAQAHRRPDPRHAASAGRRSCRSSRASLAIAAKREALVAEEGMALLPDRVIIAPGDAHLMVVDGSGRAGRPSRPQRRRSAAACRRSIRCSQSVGAVYGAGALRRRPDRHGPRRRRGRGAHGRGGGSVLAQDEASCAVWGMPRAVLEAGLACAVMPPDKLARRIASRLGGDACR